MRKTILLVQHYVGFTNTSGGLCRQAAPVDGRPQRVRLRIEYLRTCRTHVKISDLKQRLPRLTRRGIFFTRSCMTPLTQSPRNMVLQYTCFIAAFWPSTLPYTKPHPSGVKPSFDTGGPVANINSPRRTRQMMSQDSTS